MTSVDRPILFQEVRSCEHESSAADCSEIDWRFYKKTVDGGWQLADAKQIIGTDEWSDAVDSILSVYFAGDTCSIPLQCCAAY